MIHTFKEDFYGEILSVVMVGYIRPERSYDSLGKMVISLVQLSSPSFSQYFSDHYSSDGIQITGGQMCPGWTLSFLCFESFANFVCSR